MPDFDLHAPFLPMGDQPEAIAGLLAGLTRGASLCRPKLRPAAIAAVSPTQLSASAKNSQ